MDWLTFIVGLARALAWPCTVLGIALVFRHQIALLLPDVSQLRYKDFEVQFGRKVATIKAEAEQAKLPSLPDEHERPVRIIGPRKSEFGYLSELVEIAPKAAVMEAWREVERAVGDTAKRLALPPAKMNRDAVRQLIASGRIDATLVRIIDDLRNLRNTVAHTAEIEVSLDDSEEYLKLALRVIGAIREVK